MADTFAPDIGMDIGASNVTPKAGISMDMSALGALAEAFAPKKQTEEGYKRSILDPIGEQLGKYKQIANPTERAIRVNNYLSSAFQQHGSLAPEISLMAEKIVGPNYKAYDPDEVAAKDRATFNETAQGAEADAHARLEATVDGSFDLEVYNNSIAEAEAGYFKTQASLERLKVSNERRTAAEPTLFYGELGDDGKPDDKSFIGNLAQSVNIEIDKLTSDAVYRHALANPDTFNPAATAKLTTQLDEKIAQMKALAKSQLTQSGFSVKEEYTKAIDNEVDRLGIIKTRLMSSANILTEYTAQTTKMSAAIQANTGLSQAASDAQVHRKLVESGLPAGPEAVKQVQRIMIDNASPSQISLEMGKKVSFGELLSNPLFGTAPLFGQPTQNVNYAADGTQTANVNLISDEEKALFASTPPAAKQTITKNSSNLHRSWRPTKEADIQTAVGMSIQGMTVATLDVAKPLTGPQLTKFTGGTGMYEMVDAWDTKDVRLSLHADDFLSKQAGSSMAILGLANSNTSGVANGYFIYTVENNKIKVAVNKDKLAQSPELRKAVDIAGGSMDGEVVLKEAFKQNLFSTLTGGQQMTFEEWDGAKSNLESIMIGRGVMKKETSDKLIKTNQILDEGFKSLSITKIASAVETNVGAMTAVEGIPSNLTQYLPQMAEQIALRDRLDVAAATGQVDTVAKNKLDELNKGLPNILTQPTENAVIKSFRSAIEAKIANKEPIAPTETKGSNQGSFNPTTSTTSTTAGGAPVKKFTFSPTMGLQEVK